jgi:hypothetical protein
MDTYQKIALRDELVSMYLKVFFPDLPDLWTSESARRRVCEILGLNPD